MAWDPGADGVVHSLAASPDGTTIYAGGQFKHVATLTRTRIAAIDATTGAVLSWSPTVSSLVRTIVTLWQHASTSVVSSPQSRVRVGSNTARLRLAAFDATNGSLTTWNPSVDAVASQTCWSPRTAGSSWSATSRRSTVLRATSSQPLDADDRRDAPVERPSERRISKASRRALDGCSWESGPARPATRWSRSTSTPARSSGSRQGDGDVIDVEYMDGIVYAGGHFDNMVGTAARPARRLRRRRPARCAPTGRRPSTPSSRSSR